MPNIKLIRVWSCLLALTCVQPLLGQDADYKIQGEYSGSVSADGEGFKYGMKLNKTKCELLTTKNNARIILLDGTPINKEK